MTGKEPRAAPLELEGVFTLIPMLFSALLCNDCIRAGG